MVKVEDLVERPVTSSTIYIYVYTHNYVYIYIYTIIYRLRNVLADIKWTGKKNKWTALAGFEPATISCSSWRGWWEWLKNGGYREYRVSMQFLTSKLNYLMLGRSTIWPIPTSPRSEKGSADLLASILGLDIAFQARAGVAKLKPAAISFSPKVWAKTRCLAFQCSSTKAIRNRLEAKGQNNVSSNTFKNKKNCRYWPLCPY